jgi:hypothetical protein
MRKASIFVAALMLAASPAFADRVDPRQQVKQMDVPDTTGWSLLGEQTVQGKRDRDVITVGKYEGKFDQLQLVVLDSDIDLKDITVQFSNGEKWSPALKHSFRQGQRSRVIDLPGNNRTIAKIELVYANTPGGGRAKVAVYGRDKKAGPVRPDPRPMAPAAAFDAKGWTLLGEQWVDGRRDKDTLKVSKYADKFDQLTLVVTESDLELKNLVVKFGDGAKDKWSPNVKHVFKEGQRSRVIDLPGQDRIIRRIDLTYANIPGGGRAKVAIYAKNTGRQPVEIKPVVWENRGWTFLGKDTVDGWRDRDRITVKDGKPYTEVMFVVGGSDVELRNVTITLGNNEKYQLPTNVVFKEGTRTSPIDIPGKLRRIRSIDFAYANLPGGGRATVEVWARKKGTGSGTATHQETSNATNAPNGNPGVVPPLPQNNPPPASNATNAPNGNPGVVPPVVRDHR